eukprot:13563439-Ditylum_brightwellii.AAC.1
MHKLPTSLILFVIVLFVDEGRHGIIPSNIPLEVTDKYGDNKQTEEEHNHDRVDDRVPVDFGGNKVVLIKIDIPAGRP